MNLWNRDNDCYLTRLLWELNPDLRFFQLVSWVAECGYGDPFYWEEEKWNELIQDKILESLMPRG